MLLTGTVDRCVVATIQPICGNGTVASIGIGGVPGDLDCPTGRTAIRVIRLALGVPVAVNLIYTPSGSSDLEVAFGSAS